MNANEQRDAHIPERSEPASQRPTRIEFAPPLHGRWRPTAYQLSRSSRESQAS